MGQQMINRKKLARAFYYTVNKNPLYRDDEAVKRSPVKHIERENPIFQEMQDKYADLLSSKNRGVRKYARRFR